MSRSNQLLQFRGQYADYDDLMQVPIRRFHSLDALDFDMEASARYIVDVPGHSLPIDILFVPRKGAKRLLVGFHGAESRKDTTLPKFQFVRSFMSRDDSLMFISDSTLLQHEGLKITWHVGCPDTPLPALLSQVVMRAGLRAKVAETVLIGHSAGGYSAILVGSQVRNSRAISINGQTIIANHHPWAITALHQHVFTDCPTEKDMLDRYAVRFDLRQALNKRVRSSSFTLFGNEGDITSFGRFRHFLNLADHFCVGHDGGRTSHGDAFVVGKWGKEDGNPHPLPGSILPFLQLVLGEDEPSIPISYKTSPVWDSMLE